MMYESSNCSTSLPTYGIVSLFNFNHYTGYTVVFHCGLNVHFLLSSWCWSLFYVLVVILISSFEKYSNLWLIFHWFAFSFFSCRSLYISWILTPFIDVFLWIFVTIFWAALWSHWDMRRELLLQGYDTLSYFFSKLVPEYTMYLLNSWINLLHSSL